MDHADYGRRANVTGHGCELGVKCLEARRLYGVEGCVLPRDPADRMTRFCFWPCAQTKT